MGFLKQVFCNHEFETTRYEHREYADGREIRHKCVGKWKKCKKCDKEVYENYNACVHCGK